MARKSQLKPYLDAPASYLAASDEERAKVCNGAGPAGYGWAVFDTLWFLRITAAANIHDWMYNEGRSQKDKEDADLKFLVNMFMIINKETTKFFLVGQLLRLLRHRRALVYYEMVKELGRGAFRG